MTTTAVPTPEMRIREVFPFAGCDWILETNSATLARTVRHGLPAIPGIAAAAFHMRLTVTADASPRWTVPLFRGRDNLVVAAYGPADIMVFDLLERSVTGSVSSAFVADETYWQRAVIPVIVGVACAAVGVAPLHCATVARAGAGLHISGVSGAGKSTLTAALALCRFDVLSDDWTYFSLAPQGLVANALPIPLKLLPDTHRFFPQLHGCTPAISLNGELAYEVDPEKTFGASRAFNCLPERLVFLRRVDSVEWQIERVPPAEVVRQFRPALERMPECLAAGRQRQVEIIKALATRPAYSLLCSGSPHSTAERLAEWFDLGSPAREAGSDRLPSHFEVPDLMRRFEPATRSISLEHNGRTIRLQTNMEQIARVPHAIVRASPSGAGHCWTVLEDNSDWPGSAHWRDDRFSFAVRSGVGCRISDRREQRSIVYLDPNGLGGIDLLMQ